MGKFMYNGIGLISVRGSGTSGYVQTSKFCLRKPHNITQNDGRWVKYGFSTFSQIEDSEIIGKQNLSFLDPSLRKRVRPKDIQNSGFCRQLQNGFHSEYHHRNLFSETSSIKKRLVKLHCFYKILLRKRKIESIILKKITKPTNK